MARNNNKETTRWQFICNGYSRLWYLKSWLRWISCVCLVVSLIVFGAVWPVFANTGGNHNVPLYFGGIEVVAPMLSLLINAVALAILFLTRKAKFVNPAYLLSGDVFCILCLAAELFISHMSGWRLNPTSWSPRNNLQVPWGLNLAVGILHCIAFCIGIWEINAYRAMRRQSDLDAKVEDVELGELDEGIEELEVHRPQTPTRNAKTVEVPDVIRVELPDGRVVELPKGSRFELPAEYRAELPGLRVDTMEQEAESPSGSVGPWDRSPVSAASY